MFCPQATGGIPAQGNQMNIDPTTYYLIIVTAAFAALFFGRV